MRIPWGKIQSTFVTVILTIIIIWVLKEFTQKYNVPVIKDIVQTGA
jgi:hypothetical protein